MLDKRKSPNHEITAHITQDGTEDLPDSPVSRSAAEHSVNKGVAAGSHSSHSSNSLSETEPLLRSSRNGDSHAFSSTDSSSSSDSSSFSSTDGVKNRSESGRLASGSERGLRVELKDVHFGYSPSRKVCLDLIMMM